MRKLTNNQPDLWSCGKIKSSQSTNIPYQAKPLASHKDCWWQVRTWDKNGLVSYWSEPAFWSMGLLRAEEWKAQWKGAPWQGEEALSNPKFRGARDTSALPYVPPLAQLLYKSITLYNKEVAVKIIQFV